MVRSAAFWVLLLGTVVGGGCKRSDPRLEKLTTGISRDSVLTVMGVEKPERVDPYLMGGHYIEALYYARPGVDSGKTPERELSPVVVIDGKLVAWGWDRWDSIAAANRIMVAPKQ